MEVKPGYRQTDAGLIPEEWEVRLLRDVVDFANGKPHERDVKSDGRYWLITLDSVGIDGRLKKDHKKTDLLDSSLEKDDIVSVLSDLAHGNLLGLCDLIPADNTYVLNQRMGRLRLKVPASPQFVRLQINRRQDHFRKRGQGTSQKHVYRRDFDALPIPFPGPPEQEAIAEALSDADALIESMEQLLSKKRHLKQGAMQELLTGKKRLPGYRGEWSSEPLGESANVFKGRGLSRAQISAAGRRPCILYGELFTKYGQVITSILSRTDSDEGLLSVHGDVLMPGSTTTTGSDLATASALLSDNVALGGDINVIRRRPDTYEPTFFAYYLTHARRDAIAEIAQGTTIHHLYGRDLKQLAVQLPPLSEQAAIAAILSDMDTEVVALEARIAKARQLKQGMMQELLTGRIRLV